MIGGRAVLCAGCVAATLAAGCDYILRIDHIDPPGDGGSDAPRPTEDSSVSSDAKTLCAVPLLRDTFDGPVICAPWGTSYADLGATVAEQGTLVLTPAGQIGSIAGCLTPGSSQPFGSGVTAIVTELVRGTNAYTVLQIHGPEVQIKGTGTGTLLFETSGGQALGATVLYDPAMKWWRIRPEGNAIVGEYSTDGALWTRLGSSPQVPPSTVGIEIAGGTDSTFVMGAGVFDELVICP